MAMIEHFAVYADNPTALKDFYVKAFGLQVLVVNPGDPPAYFLGDDFDTAIEIIGRPPGQAGVNQRWVCHMAFWVDDYRAARLALEELGVTFETDTAVDDDHLKTAFFNDPEGNRCQIVRRAKRLGE
jgi:glyoxylase I family protein